MTSRLTPLLRGYVALEPSELTESTAPAEIARGLSNKEWKLIDVVRGLEQTLTSDLDAVRARGVQLLSTVVNDLHDDNMDRQTTRTLTEFFQSRLADRTSLVASADALSRLSTLKTFATTDAVETCRAVFSHIGSLMSPTTTTSSSVVLPQSTRYSVYVLIDHLLSRHLAAIKRHLGDEFPTQYATLVQGEKDPRNLLVSFAILKVVVLEFDLDQSSVVEDVFDVTFCYFPITFTPPKDDPYGITSRDLIDALRECLSSTPKFARLALPLLLDKLQAASEKAKRQTLEALTACFPIYGAEACGEWSQKFSEALMLEVFHATTSTSTTTSSSTSTLTLTTQDRSIRDLALDCLHSLFETLYPDPERRRRDEDEVEDADVEMKDEDDNVIRGVAVRVVRTCVDELERPDTRDAKHAIDVLVAISTSSDRLARYVVDETFAPLLDKCRDPNVVDLATVRPASLEHVATLLNSLVSSSSSSCGRELDLGQTLERHRDTLLSVLTSNAAAAPRRSSASSSVPCQVAALKGLIALVRLTCRPSSSNGTTRLFLSDEEIEFCVSTFNDFVVPTTTRGDDAAVGGEEREEEEDDEDGGEAYDQALDNLVVVSTSLPHLIQRATLPRLWALLPHDSTSFSFSSSSEDNQDEDADDDDDKKKVTTSRTRYLKALSAIAALSIPRPLFDTCVTETLDRLEKVVSLETSPTQQEGRRRRRPRPRGTTIDPTLYAHDLLSTFKGVLRAKAKTNSDDDDDVTNCFDDRFLVRLMSLFILPTTTTTTTACQEEERGRVAFDLRLLVDVGKVVELILTRVDEGRQASFFKSMDEAFSRGNLDALLLFDNKKNDDTSGKERLSRRDDSTILQPFSPFASSSCSPAMTTRQRNLSILYSSMLVASRPRVLVELPSTTTLHELLNGFVKRAIESENELQLRASLHAVASLVNKHHGSSSSSSSGGGGGGGGQTIESWLDDDDGELKKVWNTYLGGGRTDRDVSDEDDDATTRLSKRRKALRVWTWVTKALIVRSDARGYDMVEHLLRLFDDREIGRDAANELGVIVAQQQQQQGRDDDEVLSKQHFAVVRLLYKQRFFTFLLPKLVDAHKRGQEQLLGSTSSSLSSSNATDRTAAVYLIALSSLLQHIPKQLTLTELPKLLPLLITSLDLADPSLRSNVLDTLAVLVDEVPDALEPHITSIATKAIRAALVGGSDANDRSPGSIKLRISSLEFLALVPDKIPYLTLHPHKATIVKELAKAIDDPSKQVRRAAVECRSKWFMYN